MNDYRYRVTLRTDEGHEIRISLFDDYYEAVEDVEKEVRKRFGFDKGGEE